MTDDAHDPDPLLDEVALWGSLAEQEGGGKNPFDDPYGPTTDCLSSNDVVRMFRLGAESRVSDHLRACDSCMARIERFAQVRQPAVAAAPSKGRWWQILPAAEPLPAPAFRPALVHVSSMCAVMQGRMAAPLRVEILTRDHDALKGMQVWLDGPIKGVAGELHFEKGAFPWLEIEHGLISPDVKDKLRKHQRFTDRLEIRVGPSAEKPRLVGRSNVAFTRGPEGDPFS